MSDAALAEIAGAAFTRLHSDGDKSEIFSLIKEEQENKYNDKDSL